MDAAVGTNSGIDVYLQSGGTLTTPGAIPNTNDANYIEIADVNGDSRNDIVTVSDLRGLIWARNDGSSYSVWPIAGGWQTQFKVGDVNGDGRKDVVGLSSPPGSLAPCGSIARP